MDRTRYDLSNFNFVEAEQRVMAHLEKTLPLRPFAVVVLEHNPRGPHPRVVRRLPPIEARTPEGALAEARRRFPCSNEQWFTIDLPGLVR